MSNIVTQFDPSTSKAATFTAPSSSANGTLVFFNESNISLDLSFADGSSLYLPAWYHRHKCGASGSVNINWDIHQVLSSSSPPISEVIVEAFMAGESFPADGPLVRQTNIGNSVNTVGGPANSVQQDAQTPGQQFIESTPSGYPGATWQADTGGFFALQSLYAGVLQRIILITSALSSGGALPTIQFGSFNPNIGVQVNGSLSVGAASLPTNAGDIGLGGTLRFATGTISKMSAFGAYNVGSGSGSFYNHNLGVVPDFVWLTNVIGTSLGSIAYNDSTMTSTQVQLYASAANVYVRGIALKF